MKFDISAHATQEIERRQIPADLVEKVITDPDQKVLEYGNVVCCQSKVTITVSLI